MTRTAVASRPVSAGSGRRAGAARSGSGGSTSGPVRLTRRGRLVVTMLFLAVLLSALTVFGSRSAATRDPGSPLSTRTVVVAEGDTLWDIAADVAAPGHIRETVHQIREINALPGAAIVEGQRLAVPAR